MLCIFSCSHSHNHNNANRSFPSVLLAFSLCFWSPLVNNKEVKCCHILQWLEIISLWGKEQYVNFDWNDDTTMLLWICYKLVLLYPHFTILWYVCAWFAIISSKIIHSSFLIFFQHILLNFSTWGHFKISNFIFACCGPQKK